MPIDMSLQTSLQDRDFYLTIEHECAYYNDRQCQNVIPDPNIEMHADTYEQLGVIGFRRSGDHVYRPHCPDCNACKACRINIQQFRLSRNLKRCLKQNQQVSLNAVDAAYTDEYFQLYKKYLNHRHADGSMKDPTADDFKNFLICEWSDTRFLELRENGQLLAIAVVDKILNGYSAVYTFFDPDYASRSLGTFAILQEIEYCKDNNQPYLYLGYWIDQHPKMHYKSRFSALELFEHNLWLPFEKKPD